MSNPTTGEWTSKSVWNLLDEGGGEMVAAAHNSALTAAREYAAKYAQELREQLASYREKWEASETGGIQTMWKESRTIVELRQKLEQTEKVRDEWANEFRKLRDELHPPLPNK